MKLFRAIVQAEEARKRCVESGNLEWEKKWLRKAQEYSQKLPSGSGFSTTHISECSNQKLTLDGAFHIMNENGYYDGSVRFRVTVLPGLEEDFGLGVKALKMKWPRKYLDLKDYIADCFAEALAEEV